MGFLSTSLLIASHDLRQKIQLQKPYKQIFRLDKVDSLNQSKFGKSDVIIASQLYSEYPVFWSQFPLPFWVSTFGFFHYRCFLDLGGEFKTSRELSRDDAVRIVSSQISHISLLRKYLVVGVPEDFSSLNFSAWQQFTFWHADAEEDLISACNEFKRLTGIDAQKVLMNTNKLYSRNIFLGRRSFATEWYRISRSIYSHLEEKGIRSEQDRSGGYILERLFSVFVSQFESKPYFRTRNFIYVVDL